MRACVCAFACVSARVCVCTCMFLCAGLCTCMRVCGFVCISSSSYPITYLVVGTPRMSILSFQFFVCLPLLLPLSLCIGRWLFPIDRGLRYIRAYSVGDMVCACDVQNCSLLSPIHSLYSPLLFCRSTSRKCIDQTLHRYILSFCFFPIDLYKFLYATCAGSHELFSLRLFPSRSVQVCVHAFY